MIKPLRKRHLQTWSALLLLIPAGIFTAWLSVKEPVHHDVLQPSSGQGLPNMISSVEKEDYTVRLRSNDTRSEQIEWVNKKILTIPSAVIYEVVWRNAVQSRELIGRIEAVGNYFFPLRDSNNERPKLILYDFIHEQTIDSINFEP
jgi:hypothetical protein